MGNPCNLFDQVAQIQAGETLGPVTLGYVDYPRSAGWTLNCVIFGQTGKECECAAVAAPNPDTDSFVLAIPAASTAAIGVRPSETRGRPGAARRFAAAGGGAGSK